MSRAPSAAIAALSLAATWYAPALTAVGPVRRALTPTLAGRGDPGHVALTFDDGPSRCTTPHFLEVLASLGVRATFFALGERVAGAPGVARDVVEAGHELAVHGWDHRCLALRPPVAAYDDLARTRDLIADTTGAPPCWWRPAYGVLTLPLLCASRRLDLTPVLWTHWGRDWAPRATPETVARTVTSRLRGGSVLLLHDAPAGGASVTSWNAALGALPSVIERCRAQNLTVGPLAEHGLSKSRPTSGQGVARVDSAQRRDPLLGVDSDLTSG